LSKRDNEASVAVGGFIPFLIKFKMKLFITNKDYFEEFFVVDPNSKREPLSSNEIHKKLFTQLSKKIDIENSIPLCLLQSYDNGEGVAVFDFITKRGDIYYYQFSATAS
jgi:hypothetical protein